MFQQASYSQIEEWEPIRSWHQIQKVYYGHSRADTYQSVIFVCIRVHVWPFDFDYDRFRVGISDSIWTRALDEEN